MAWFKCNSGGSNKEKPEWPIVLRNLDFSSDDPYDTISPSCDTLLFNMTTDKSAVYNNNSVGLVTLDPTKPLPKEPGSMNCSIQLALTTSTLKIFIRGRLCFDDSDAEQKAVGEITGATRTFQGDFRNTDILVNIGYRGRGDTTTFSYKDSNDQWVTLAVIQIVGVPVKWAEGHEYDWHYITAYSGNAANYVEIGAWYGGGLSSHEFDGHINYLKMR